MTQAIEYTVRYPYRGKSEVVGPYKTWNEARQIAAEQEDVPGVDPDSVEVFQVNSDKTVKKVR